MRLLHGPCGTVAAVVDTPRGCLLPRKWNGFKVIDGDLSDARWLDPKSVIVGLRAKGNIDLSSPFVFNV